MKRNPVSRKEQIAGIVRVKIRSVRSTDAQRIAELSTQLGYPVSKQEMRKRIVSVAKRKDQKLLAANLDGKVVGWLEIFRPRSVLNWDKAEIGALVVDDRYRRQGVGKGLMHKAHDWAKRNNCPFIYLRSNIIRKEAHIFYRRSGYTVYKTQYVFRYILQKTKQSRRK